MERARLGASDLVADLRNTDNPPAAFRLGFQECKLLLSVHVDVELLGDRVEPVVDARAGCRAAFQQLSEEDR